MNPLTPNNGSQYQPYGGDHASASYGNFTYQVVVQDLDDVTAASLYTALGSQQFKGALNKAYTGESSTSDDMLYSTVYFHLYK